MIKSRRPLAIQVFFFSSRRRHTRCSRDWSSDVCSSDLSKPGFDPNLFVDGIDPQGWAELNNSIDKPLNNRAIAGMYPPGSTFKPFIALARLELAKRTPRSTIHHPGDLDFGARGPLASRAAGNCSATLNKSR